MLEVTHLERAIKSLEEGIELFERSRTLDSITQEAIRDGVIQRFEFTYELCWKSLKRFLVIFGADIPPSMTMKDIYRVGFERDLIRDAELWFGYMKYRNLSSHTYDSETAEEVYSHIADFLVDANYLLNRLKAIEQ